MTTRRIFPVLGTATVLFSITISTGAQDKSKYYTVQHPKEFAIDWKGFYDKGDALTGETRKQFPNHLDLAYGKDPKQKLDLYLPTNKPSAAPVFIFLHGGGFREGDRAHYGFVARPLVTQGVIAVIASYRLLPAFHYPDQLEDTQQIVNWVHHNIRSYGGDPGRIYLGGHSAGAMLTAEAGVNTAWLARMSLPADIIKGCVPVSGSYDLEKRASDYVPDTSRRAEASPMANVVKPAPAWVIAVGSAEASNPPIRPEDSQAFGARIREKGAAAEVLVLEGMSHAQTALSLGDDQGVLVRAILGMIKAPPARSPH